MTTIVFSIHIVTDTIYGPEQLAMKVADGEIKYAVINHRIARHMASRLHGLDCALEISLSQFQAWTLAPADTTLRDTLNARLARAKLTPAYRQLYSRYFNN